MRSALRHGSVVLPRLLARPSLTSRTAHLQLRPAQCQLIVNSSVNRCFHRSTLLREQAAAEAAADEASVTPDSPTKFTRFQELADHNVLHPVFVDTLTRRMKLDTMTEVQSRTISTTVNGNDCIAQARTGTGKTIAFLLPILQNIVSKDPSLAKPNARQGRPARTTSDDIRAVIISPTRELAEQIAAEAARLVAGTSVVVQCAVGGTQKSAGLRAIQRQGCHILVATPGRLLDILSDPYTRVEAPDLSMLVFDEADRLLEQGFWEPIQEIMTHFPDPQDVPRQTLMFSATVPKEVVHMVRNILKPGFTFEQCVREGEEPTHERVPQFICPTNGLENQIPAVIELCQREIKKAVVEGGRPFKAIIYFSATNEVNMAHEVFRQLHAHLHRGSGASDSIQEHSHAFGGVRCLQIHSKLSQVQRTRAALSFRQAKTGILLSSDVTARGLDFPDVTHVIQVGSPVNAEQYVHRIGRTARAGKEGEAWLFVDETLQLAPARKLLGHLPIKRNDTLEIPKLDLTQHLQVSENASEILSMVQQAMNKVPRDMKEDCFRSLIGAYRPSVTSSRTLVAKLNNLSTYSWGLEEPPAISATVARTMGMDGIPELRLADRRAPRRESNFADRSDDPFSPRSGGFGGRPSGFGDRSSGFGGRSGGGSGGYGGRSGGFGGRGGRRSDGRSSGYSRPSFDRRSGNESQASF